MVSEKVYLSVQQKQSSISLKICGSLAAIGGTIFGQSDEKLPTELTEGLCEALGHNAKPLVSICFSRTLPL
jgi:hypothetical protein